MVEQGKVVVCPFVDRMCPCQDGQLVTVDDGRMVTCPLWVMDETGEGWCGSVMIIQVAGGILGMMDDLMALVADSATLAGELDAARMMARLAKEE